jgi:hypothetical protein
VAKCSEVAKVVVVEQAEKKAAEAKAKASVKGDTDRFLAALRGVDGVAGGNPPPPGSGIEPADMPAASTDGDGTAGVGVSTGNETPGPFEATEGAAPEITVHSETAMASGEELAPEERAISGVEVDKDADEARKDFADEDTDTAALAEGRTEPPQDRRDEPAA